MPRHIKDQLVGLDANFRYRGLNQTRVETFSDAVFALAITLVVLSSTVPETFEELRSSMSDVLPFFLCVVLVVVIWMQHYQFFLKYGLQNTRTIVYNTFLLFLVLVYVYPLKFLMKFLVSFYYSLITGQLSTFNETYSGQIQEGDMRILMMIYGLGAAFIFFTLTMLYRHAYRKKAELELNEYELFETKSAIGTNILLGSIPFFSFLVAAIGGAGQLTYIISGFSYMLYPIVMPIYGSIVRKRQKKLFG
ncbi:MAG: TMEM175 family protein [Cyclobacteriaceae bacterium]